jgi:hypothetical protein
MRLIKIVFCGSSGSALHTKAIVRDGQNVFIRSLNLDQGFADGAVHETSPSLLSD